jgi:hypothetical protein
MPSGRVLAVQADLAEPDQAAGVVDGGTSASTGRSNLAG